MESSGIARVSYVWNFELVSQACSFHKTNKISVRGAVRRCPLLFSPKRFCRALAHSTLQPICVHGFGDGDDATAAVASAVLINATTRVKSTSDRTGAVLKWKVHIFNVRVFSRLTDE